MQLTCAACPGFVEFVERGESASDQVHVLAERLLAPVRGGRVDTLLLGCTHYPFLARTIGDVMGRHVVLVSSADETAFEVAAVLVATSRGWAGMVAPARAQHRRRSPDQRRPGHVPLPRGRRLLGPEVVTVEQWTPWR